MFGILSAVMLKGKIVLFTVPYDQGDILQDFLERHITSASTWIAGKP
jgi:hypothetical protein